MYRKEKIIKALGHVVFVPQLKDWLVYVLLNLLRIVRGTLALTRVELYAYTYPQYPHSNFSQLIRTQSQVGTIGVLYLLSLGVALKNWITSWKYNLESGSAWNPELFWVTGSLKQHFFNAQIYLFGHND